MITLKDVDKVFGKFKAVDALSLEIPTGSIFGLLGPNGAGKSTLLRMLMGLISPTKGSIKLFDNFTPGSKEVKNLLGYMPQQLAVYSGLTVKENIRYFGHLYGVKGTALKERCQELIEAVELVEKQNELVKNLSGGMVRRVLLASAVVHKPKLLILDEPTAGVDPVLRLKFWKWFQTWTTQGTSILITTHHISEATNCAEVMFMRAGKKIQVGTPQFLMEKYGVNDLESAFVKATHKVEGAI